MKEISEYSEKITIYEQRIEEMTSNNEKLLG